MQSLEQVIRKLQPAANIFRTEHFKIEVEEIVYTNLFDFEKASESAGWIKELNEHNLYYRHAWMIKNILFGGFVMGENYSLTKESNKPIAENANCILTTGYQITIPKLIRENLNLLSGDELTIRLKSKELIIRKPYEDRLENIMIINERGAVKIPQEFINILSLKKGDVFNLYLTNSSIILKKKSKD